MPILVESVPELRQVVAGWRRQDHSIGLVPTMGSLHAGHLSLVESALADNQRVVVSIFVNPLQFGPTEDYHRYPRPLRQDLDLLGELGADLVVFHPSLDEMYPQPPKTSIAVGDLGRVLEGLTRPGHFDGVATVVTKLLNLAGPDRAYFGQKDAQQLAIVRQLVRDLDLGVEIIGCPIVRDLDGLALSSRNGYLSPVDRAGATALFRGLVAANQAHAYGGQVDTELARVRILEILGAEPHLEVDYVELVDPDTLLGVGRLALVAARLNGVRLIDNHIIGHPLVAGIGPSRLTTSWTHP
ncbi:MAG TPA: pantoate--beta-alanine ligase [Candidatus Dormibacteraeota bacterium]|jgi:pantoate--beta-alanine ligase|nr:pantoate--beta-alanine ligase [Candidatus Dormibacteraeota bacterium]